MWIFHVIFIFSFDISIAYESLPIKRKEFLYFIHNIVVKTLCSQVLHSEIFFIFNLFLKHFSLMCMHTNEYVTSKTYRYRYLKRSPTLKIPAMILFFFSFGFFYLSTALWKTNNLIVVNVVQHFVLSLHKAKTLIIQILSSCTALWNCF